MNEPWFNPAYFAWIPGTLLGMVAGTWGSLGGTLAPRGKAKGLVMGLGWLIVGASAALLAVGLTALVVGQPYGIWYGFGLPGLLGTCLGGGLLPVVRKAYLASEQRRMHAQDM